MLLKGGAIRLGDRTSGGGVVITTSGGGGFLISNASLALVGDKATCELHGGIQTFVEGCLNHNDDGKGWVIEGCRLSCGCFAYSSCAANFMVEDHVGQVGLAGVSAGSPLGVEATSLIGAAVSGAFDQQFQLIDTAGSPLPNVKYRLVSDAGVVTTGVTDGEGRTQRVFSTESELLHLYRVV